MLKLLLSVIAFTTFLITAVIFQNSAASASLGTLGSQSGSAIENQPKSGVPFILHLGYVNGSIPLTGKLGYTVRFSFNDPFIISGVNKGTFDDATVLNKTAVRFQSSSISELQNKTGLVLFSFQNGLAEKHRILTNLTHNVTLSIPPPLYPQNSTTNISRGPGGNGGPASAPGGAGGNAIATQSGSETYVCNASNACSVPSANANGGAGGIAASNPPLIPPPTPTRTLTASLQTGPLSASIVDLSVGITDLGSNVFGLIKEAYNATTPCASIGGEYVGKSAFPPVASIIQYSLGVNNCSAHPELLSISTVVPQGIKTILEKDRFDSEAHSMNKLSMFVIIPLNYSPGIYTFKIDGKVLFNFFGTFYVVSETTGNASPPFILTP